MKGKYVLLGLVLLTAVVAAYIFENVNSILEEASHKRFRPVTTGLPQSQIHRDIEVGSATADFYTAEANQAVRPLLIVVHGGFLQGGNKKNYAFLGGLGVRQGFVVAVLQLPHYPGVVTRPFYSKKSLVALSLEAQAKNFAAFVKDVSTLAQRYRFDAKKIHVMALQSGALLLAAVDLQSLKSLTLVSPILSLKENAAQIAPLQMHAITQAMALSEAEAFAPKTWLPQTRMPVLLLCADRDLPYIKDTCRNFGLMRKGGAPIERFIDSKPSHFEMLFHLGSRIEEASDPLKKFWFDVARL